MTRTIAIDTSHTSGSLAAGDGVTVVNRPLGARGEHARQIAAALDAATGQLGWRLDETELIVVVRGPGSFTGLRVGVAAAKSVAWASGAKLVGACGFEILAREAARLLGSPERDFSLAFDAGRGEVYAATATPDTSPSGFRIGPAALQKAETWVESLPPHSVVSGPAMTSLIEKLSTAGHHIAPPEVWFPSALAAMSLGIDQATAGSLDAAASLVPHYMRASYAEESTPQAS